MVLHVLLLRLLLLEEIIYQVSIIDFIIDPKWYRIKVNNDI